MKCGLASSADSVLNQTMLVSFLQQYQLTAFSLNFVLRSNDFKAFRYLPLSRKLILPKSEWTSSEKGNFDGFVVYDVSANEIKSSDEIQHASSYDMYYGCWYNARMPARSFVFKSKLTTILSHSVISTDLNTGDRLWDLNLDKGLNNTECAVSYFW